MAYQTDQPGEWPQGTVVRLRRGRLGVRRGTLCTVDHFVPAADAYAVRFKPWASLSMVSRQDLELVADLERSVGA